MNVLGKGPRVKVDGNRQGLTTVLNAESASTDLIITVPGYVKTLPSAVDHTHGYFILL